MIYVTIERLAPDSPHISSFVVEGHAEYDVPGKDLSAPVYQRLPLVP